MSGGNDDPIFLTQAPSSEDGRLDAVRERAADALQAASAFIDEHGDALMRLRSSVLLEAEPPAALIDALAPRQRDDGSFPPLGLVEAGATGFEGARAALSDDELGCLEALALLSDARALHAAYVEPVAVHLQQVQRDDGSWGDPSAALDDRLFATGMLAGFLGRTRFVRPIVLQDAGDFLGPLWTPDRVEGGAWPVRTAFAQFFTNVHHDLADEALQWCGRETERAFRVRSADAVATMRVLLYCDAQALPGATFDVMELIEGILGEQARDGGFAELSGGAPPQRVAATHDAMFGLIRLCRALPPE